MVNPAVSFEYKLTRELVLGVETGYIHFEMEIF